MEAIRQAARDIVAAHAAGHPYCGAPVGSHQLAWAQWVLWHVPKAWPALIEANECFTEIVL